MISEFYKKNPWIWGPDGNLEWSAWWCWAPKKYTDMEIAYFRRTFNLEDSGGVSLEAKVTADSRYILYVNGELVGRGPAKGDFQNWRYETDDLSGLLRSGRNVVTGVVQFFNHNRAPASQISFQPVFLFQGTVFDSQDRELVNLDTAEGWKVWLDTAYSRDSGYASNTVSTIYTHNKEIVDGRKYPHGWQHPDFDDNAWPFAEKLYPAFSKNTFGDYSLWRLVPRPIPLLEETPFAPRAVVQEGWVDVTVNKKSPGEHTPGSGFRFNTIPEDISPQAHSILEDNDKCWTGCFRH